MHIAYMEDDKIAREETTSGLINMGFSVEHINNNNDALRFAEKYRELPQVMYVLDINMGSGNTTLGVKVSRNIKALHQNSYVVLLTSKIREIDFDYIHSSKADEILRKGSINNDIESISQKALLAFKEKELENKKSVLDKPVLKPTYDELFLPSIKKIYGTYFDICCVTKTPNVDFFNKITDKFVSSEFVSENLATALVELSITSKQPHDADLFEQLLIDFSAMEIPIRTIEPLIEHEKEAITFMILYTETGTLNSFGGKFSFRDTDVLVTPGILDLIDTNCETLIVEDIEDNSLININIRCIIFGVYS